MTDRHDDATTATRRKGLRIFRRNQGVQLEESGAMSDPVLDMEEMKAVAADGPRPANAAAGIFSNLVFRGEGEDGMSLVRVWLGPHFVLPRHTHHGDCLYYLISGTITMGAQELVAGDGFHVPSDAPYAYEAGPDGAEVLEFRTVTSFDMNIPAGQLDRWRRMATAAAANGDGWVANRPTIPA